MINCVGEPTRPPTMTSVAVADYAGQSTQEEVWTRSNQRFLTSTPNDRDKHGAVHIGH